MRNGNIPLAAKFIACENVDRYMKLLLLLLNVGKIPQNAYPKRHHTNTHTFDCTEIYETKFPEGSLCVSL